MKIQQKEKSKYPHAGSPVDQDASHTSSLSIVIHPEILHLSISLNPNFLCNFRTILANLPLPTTSTDRNVVKLNVAKCVSFGITPLSCFHSLYSFQITQLEEFELRKRICNDVDVNIRIITFTFIQYRIFMFAYLLSLKFFYKLTNICVLSVVARGGRRKMGRRDEGTDPQTVKDRLFLHLERGRAKMGIFLVRVVVVRRERN